MNPSPTSSPEEPILQGAPTALPTAQETLECQLHRVVATTTFMMREYAFELLTQECVLIEVKLSINSGPWEPVCSGKVTGGGTDAVTLVPTSYCFDKEILAGDVVEFQVSTSPATGCTDIFQVTYEDYTSEYTQEYYECV